ncbi:MAG: zinc-ribbon domain-containing protein [Bacilli bacterium]|nr:zinc-ribbon domain-containing protein [Bacilli bacterium]
MALIKCKECGNEISSTSKKCVHCGAKLKDNSKNIVTSVAIVGVLIFIGFFIYMLATDDARSQKRIDDSVNETNKTLDCIRRGMEYSSSKDKCVEKGWGD